MSWEERFSFHLICNLNCIAKQKHYNPSMLAELHRASFSDSMHNRLVFWVLQVLGCLASTARSNFSDLFFWILLSAAWANAFHSSHPFWFMCKLCASSQPCLNAHHPSHALYILLKLPIRMKSSKAKAQNFPISGKDLGDAWVAFSSSLEKGLIEEKEYEKYLNAADPFNPWCSFPASSYYMKQDWIAKLTQVLCCPVISPWNQPSNYSSFLLHPRVQVIPISTLSLVEVSRYSSYFRVSSVPLDSHLWHHVLSLHVVGPGPLIVQACSCLGKEVAATSPCKKSSVCFEFLSLITNRRKSQAWGSKIDAKLTVP